MGKDKEPKEEKQPKGRKRYDATILHTQGQLSISNVAIDAEDGTLCLETAEGAVHVLAMEHVIHAVFTPVAEVP